MHEPIYLWLGRLGSLRLTCDGKTRVVVQSTVSLPSMIWGRQWALQFGNEPSISQTYMKIKQMKIREDSREVLTIPFAIVICDPDAVQVDYTALRGI